MKITLLAVRTGDIEAMDNFDAGFRLQMRGELPPCPVFEVVVDLSPPVLVEEALTEAFRSLKSRIINDLYVSPTEAVGISRGQALKKLLLSVQGKTDAEIEEMAASAAL